MSTVLEWLKLWSYGIRNYGFNVSSSGITSLLNFIKIYQLVQKFIGGGGEGDRQTHREGGYFISLLFSFRKESRLNMLHLSKTTNWYKCYLGGGHT
jgi:hypothetical protein